LAMLVPSDASNIDSDRLANAQPADTTSGFVPLLSGFTLHSRSDPREMALSPI
jgi:hypothetical protein